MRVAPSCWYLTLHSFSRRIILLSTILILLMTRVHVLCLNCSSNPIWIPLGGSSRFVVTFVTTRWKPSLPKERRKILENDRKRERERRILWLSESYGIFRRVRSVAGWIIQSHWTTWILSERARCRVWLVLLSLLRSNVPIAMLRKIRY